MPDTEFAELIDFSANAKNKTLYRMPPDWMQGRTVYGGLVAAMALTAMRSHVSEDRKVRSLLISFVGPVNAEPFRIQTRPLRSGKSVTTIEAHVIQNEEICFSAIGSFGGERESVVQTAPGPRPSMAEPAVSLELPYIEGMTPAFTRHFAYRWAIGAFPFSGKGGQEIGGWINFKEETDCLTEAWLVALADAWPTPVLSGLSTPAAASTMTWALQFVHLNRDTCSENEWWGYHCTVDSAEKGYVHERSRVWDPDGNLALFSQQTTALFA